MTGKQAMAGEDIRADTELYRDMAVVGDGSPRNSTAARREAGGDDKAERASGNSRGIPPSAEYSSSFWYSTSRRGIRPSTVFAVFRWPRGKHLDGECVSDIAWQVSV